MTLEWNEQAQQEGTVLYTLSCAGNDEDAIKAGVEAALEKAVSLLDRNVRDDSRYLLCEWNADAARLQVVVSDD